MADVFHRVPVISSKFIARDDSVPIIEKCTLKGKIDRGKVIFAVIHHRMDFH